MASFWRQSLTFTVVMEEQPSGRSPEGCSHCMHFGGAQSRYSKLSFMPARQVLHVSAWLMNSSDAFASVLADHLQILHNASNLSNRRLSETADHQY